MGVELTDALDVAAGVVAAMAIVGDKRLDEGAGVADVDAVVEVVAIAEGETAAAGVAEVVAVDGAAGVAEVVAVDATLDEIEEVAALSVDLMGVDAGVEADEARPSTDVAGLAAAAGPAEELAVLVDAPAVEAEDVTADAVAAPVVASGTIAGLEGESELGAVETDVVLEAPEVGLDAVAGSVAFTLVAAGAVVVEEEAPELTNVDVTGSITSIKELERVLVDDDAETTPLLDVNAGSAPALSLHRAQRRVNVESAEKDEEDPCHPRPKHFSRLYSRPFQCLAVLRD